MPCIPTGYWLGQAWKNVDIRRHGSGNLGATNVFRDEELLIAEEVLRDCVNHPGPTGGAGTGDERPYFALGAEDPEVIAFGSEYLTIVSLNFLASGIAFSSSSVFQGLGNTVPPLLSTASRLLLFAFPAIWLSHRAGFQIRQVWYLSVMSQVIQAGFSLLLLRRELGRKLKFDEVPIAGPVMEAGQA